MPKSEMQIALLGSGENKRDEKREIHRKEWGGGQKLMQRAVISVSEYFKSLGLKYPSLDSLQGQEDNVGENIIVPLLEARRYINPLDIIRKPQILHEIVGSRREPDYGIYQYQTKPRVLFGVVVDVKKFDEQLTPKMEEKLAGYCGLAGARYGLLCNGKELIIIRPIRGVVEWEYCDSIPDKEVLKKEIISEPKRYDEPSIVYAGRITNEVTAETVTDLAKRFHDIIRSRKGMAVPDRLYEFSKLLVVRIMDELGYKKGKQPDLYLTSKSLDKIVEAGGKVAQHVNNRFAVAQVELGIFKDGEVIDLPDDLIEQMIRELDEYALWSEQLDVLGQVYEQFLQNTMTGKELGQYFTPRSIVETIIQMIDPHQGQTILDPACGSGGFLIYALLYLVQKHRAYTEEERKAVAQPFKGADVFEKAASLCQINLWLHGDCHDNVVRADSLNANEVPDFLKLALQNPVMHGFDIIITNPPFGAKEGTRLRKEDVKRLSQKWELSDVNLFECASPGKDLQPQSPFIELCIKALKKPTLQGKGGRLGIVIDNGIFSNINKEEPKIRQIIRRECIIEAIVGLPKGTFKPYGSNVVPCFAILRRRAPNEHQGPIFRAEVSKIGFVAGYTRYKDAPKDDLMRIVDLWKAWTADSVKTSKIIDASLPVWATDGDDDRLDNNFWSPASFQAAAQVKELEDSGKITKLSFDQIIADKGIVTGVKPSLEGIFGILEGHNLRPNYIVPTFIKFSEEQGPDLKPGDILLGKDGEPGTFAVITRELLDFNPEIAIGGHVYRIRLRDEYIKYAYFLTLFLNSKLGQALVRKYIAGGTTPTIRSDDLKKIVVCLPRENAETTTRGSEDTIRTLQSDVIKVISNIEFSANLLDTIGARAPEARLPINWSGGGRSDPHGYDLN
jgi:type I restriction-modification system DNA methylase subunit